MSLFSLLKRTKQYILAIILLLLIANNIHGLTFSGGKGNIPHQISAYILGKAYQRIGIYPKFRFLQLQASLNASNSGKTDGEISRIKMITKKFPNLLEVPIAINYVEGVAFAKNKKIKIHSWQDLLPYKIAIIEGTKFIEQGTIGTNRILTKNFDEAFKLLNNNEIDLVVAPKMSGLFVIYKNKYNKIKPIGSILQRLDLYHFVHKKNIDLIPKIALILRSMKNNQEFFYLRSAYFDFLISQ